MATDANNLARYAQPPIVEAAIGSGSPPSYGPWQPVWGAKVDRVEINASAKPSQAIVWFPELRWDADTGLKTGDMLRIRTLDPVPTISFAGFIAGTRLGFSGGGQGSGGKGPDGFERNVIVALDHRWLLQTTCPVDGRLSRGPDDYTDFGTPSQTPIDDKYTFLSGCRAIFNKDGRPDKDPTDLTHYIDAAEATSCDIPLFANDTVDADPWTARDMIRYILSPIYNLAIRYLPILDPANIKGIDHADLDNVISHIVVEGLNVLDALDVICSHAGFGFRLDHNSDGTTELILYRIGSAAGYSRSIDTPTILQQLHAPAVAEDITAAVEAGARMLCNMSLAVDSSAIVNNPWGLAAPDKFEITAELVPAWLDSNLDPDTSGGLASLFFTEADLQDITDPNSKTFYKYYHARGSSFLRDVGRKWTLNEAGAYSSATYDRGMPFDFSTVIPAAYILDSETGERLYAPVNRQLLPCLTFDKDSLNTVGIKVEFSFDSGDTWQVIPAAISSLTREAGIYIEDPNLAELVDQAEGTISGGTLDGVQLNLFTSLADDLLTEPARSFKDGDWNTRVRVTASVQMDQRLRRMAEPTHFSGSPFWHAMIYDFSEKYGITERTDSSTFKDSGLPAWNIDRTDWFIGHLEKVRRSNEDMSISGVFTLDRLWLGDGTGVPVFCIGDSVERITGREKTLAAAFGTGVVYPEIVQIVYLPDGQQQQLITRDLRYAEVRIA